LFTRSCIRLDSTHAVDEEILVNLMNEDLSARVVLRLFEVAHGLGRAGDQIRSAAEACANRILEEQESSGNDQVVERIGGLSRALTGRAENMDGGRLSVNWMPIDEIQFRKNSQTVSCKQSDDSCGKFASLNLEREIKQAKTTSVLCHI
jgi:hypothetical protein